MKSGLGRCVALLPMKANSQRVKGKNFRPLNGKPLFYWILESLLEIEEIDKVVINTDARSILETFDITNDSRVKIRDRNQSLIGDEVSMNLILKDDIDAVKADTYVMTHATNPMLSAKTIRDALLSYQLGVENEGKDSLFTVNKIQTRFYRQDSTPVNHDPANLIQTQDLEPWFEENSNLYIFSETSFSRTNARIGKDPILHVMNKIEAVDIDTLEDWALAEAISKMLEARTGEPT